MFSSRFLSGRTGIITKRSLYRKTSYTVKDPVATSSDLLQKAIESRQIRTAEDWKCIRNEVLTASSSFRSQINPTNIDAMTVGVCTSMKRYDLASSYFDYLNQEQIKPNLATMGKYFTLLYLKNCNKALSAEDEEQILNLYESLRKSYPVLDSSTLTSIVKAISITKKWRLCLDLFDEIKVMGSPSVFCYSAIISAAFLNNDNDLAWNLLKELLESGRTPTETVYLSYFTKVGDLDKKLIISATEKMLQFLHENSLRIDNASADKLMKVVEKIGLVAHVSRINNKGFCQCCKKKLETFSLSDSEFQHLQKQVIQNMIVGKDVFNKSTLEELFRFKDFVANMERFDVVVDGLNVAYSVGVKQSPMVTSGLVASVVSHFAKQGQKVLVLGRKHMEKWPKKNWGYILENATVFLTENLSQDDPYLLYCALKSGRDTIIVTKDLMRSQKFLLQNLHQKLLFDRWLSQRQYQLVYVDDNGNPRFKLPGLYSEVAQENGGCWHVPFGDWAPNRSKSGNAWLCLNCRTEK